MNLLPTPMFFRAWLSGLSIFLLVLSTHIQAAQQPRVLFDEGHGQRFSVTGKGELDLSEFAKLFGDAGFIVESPHQPLTDSLLSGVAALVISGPFQRYGQEEQSAIDRFMVRGGRLAIMLHVGPINGPLLKFLGVAVSNGVLMDQTNLLNNKATDFAVRRLAIHPLFAGIDSFNLYGSWALKNWSDSARVIASSSSRSWLDLNRNRVQDVTDPEQAFGVVVIGQREQGAFVVFGDDAVFQNRFLQRNNLALARNLVRWMSGSLGDT